MVARSCFPAMLVAASFLLPLGAVAAQGVRPVYREIGDWLLACDNVRACLARKASDPGREQREDDGDVRLDIARDAGPFGAIRVRIGAETRVDPTAFLIPGHPIVPASAWRLSNDGQDATLAGEPARRFVRGLADAGGLTRSQSGESSISLRGLAAILLAMDEAQGRVGNASALMRPGPIPAGATPIAARLPVVSVGPPLRDPKALVGAIRRIHARFFAAHDCDMAAGAGDEAYPLTASDALVVVGCGRFAYQASVLVFRTPRNRPGAARLVAMPDPPVGPPSDPSASGEYVEGRYDPATRVFAEYSKGRGMADCGSATEWTFDGAAFRLSAYRWQDRCDGALPGDWPILYRTRR